MEFKECVKALVKRSKQAESQALTEEATKTSVILPFIRCLGFDVFNLDEVVPEFIADVGIKKGEKVDFAIKIDGKIEILVEVKPINSKLSDTQVSQLYRYFSSVTESRLGILTNGKEAWFFSDIDSLNQMDKKPFFVFDFQSNDDSQVEELSRYQKGIFKIDSIIEAASNLKYVRKAAQYIKNQLENPENEFVKLVGRSIYHGSLTKAVSEQLRPAIQSALDEIIRDRIQDKLEISFRPDNFTLSRPDAESTSRDKKIVTTDEEEQAYRIIQAIGARITDVKRIYIRDHQNFCNVLMDDNNRKPICRFYFSSPTTKSIGIFDDSKKETKHEMKDLSEIYNFIDQIESVIKSYNSCSSKEERQQDESVLEKS
ncbi:MAG: type I restriction enzyme HsdR N-terminal domain-containing protein [Alphaproteobacteria bacterium]|nr:type I restriction enzyme HsdR N-terminal domain-containing protein [Alphaproteobacteria bacterium]